jgi:hypothetical protein
MMRGAPINIDNIAKEVEDGFHRLTNKINEFGDGINDKHSQKKNSIQQLTPLCQPLRKGFIL